MQFLFYFLLKGCTPPFGSSVFHNGSDLGGNLKNYLRHTHNLFDRYFRICHNHRRQLHKDFCRNIQIYILHKFWLTCNIHRLLCCNQSLVHTEHISLNENKYLEKLVLIYRYLEFLKEYEYFQPINSILTWIIVIHSIVGSICSIKRKRYIICCPISQS